MKFVDFKDVMKRAKPGQHIRYHVGELALDRTNSVNVELIARFVETLYEIDTARLWQRREAGRVCYYYVTLTRRLRTRRDDQGSFQEAERIRQL